MKKSADMKKRIEMWVNIIHDIEIFKNKQEVRELWIDGIPEKI